MRKLLTLSLLAFTVCLYVPYLKADESKDWLNKQELFCLNKKINVEKGNCLARNLEKLDRLVISEVNKTENIIDTYGFPSWVAADATAEWKELVKENNQNHLLYRESFCEQLNYKHLGGSLAGNLKLDCLVGMTYHHLELIKRMSNP